MGSQPPEVTFQPLPQPKQVLNLVTPEGCKAELTYSTDSKSFSIAIDVFVYSTACRWTPAYRYAKTTSSGGRTLMAAMFGLDREWGVYSGRAPDLQRRRPGDRRRRVLAGTVCRATPLAAAAARFHAVADSTKLSRCSRSSAGAACARKRSTHETERAIVSLMVYWSSVMLYWSSLMTVHWSSLMVLYWSSLMVY